VGSLLLSGCLNTMPTLPEQVAASSISAPAAPTFPPSQRSDTIDIFVNDQHSLPAENLSIAPEKTTNLWARIRAGFKVPLPGGEAAQRVVRHERWFLEHPERLERMFARARFHMVHIVEAVEKEGLPLEFALLPVLDVEFFIPKAGSSPAISRLWGWGTIETIGRRYLLKPCMFSNEQPNGTDNTQAALRYLKELQARYDGDFQLVMAAWSSESLVDSQVRKAKARGLPGRFEDLQLDIETANYVPRVLALAKVVSAAMSSENATGITLPPMVNAR
jgi:membrane-bound lytic murein transglycosylase D